MKVSLKIKQTCSFFWLRAIRKARIDKCCAKCFIGDRFNKFYEQTYFKDKIQLMITDARQIDFQKYKSTPEGEFGIFENYLLDGIPL